MPNGRIQRRAAATLGLLLLVALQPAAGAGALSLSPSPAPAGDETIGGRTWTDDIRVTVDAGLDTSPMVMRAPSGNISLFWISDRSGTAAYYRAGFDARASETHADTFVSDRILTLAQQRVVYGPTIAIDGNEDAHLAFDDDYQNIGYTKVAANGTVLVSEKRLGVVDNSASSTPSLAVGSDDTVHISNLDYKFQCEDLVYAKLDNNGTEIWTNRVVSSDVASRVVAGLIRADPYSGNLLFAFAATNGMWLGRMDRYGIKNMASVKLQALVDSRLPDIAATRNGDIHAVWQNNNQILYSRVNASGVVMDNAVAITPTSATEAGPPRIVGMGDNRAVVVWDDLHGGPRRQVFYAVINASGVGGGLPAIVQLTSSAGEATMPWVAAGDIGDIYVAWTDTRDGNSEVYYKMAYGCGAELYGEPIDLAGMFFLHPGQTAVLPFVARNRGVYLDDFDLTLEVTPGAFSRGWNVTLSPTELLGVDDGHVGFVNLSVTPPADAGDGDGITMNVTLTSRNFPGCLDRVSITSFVHLIRALGLSASEAIKTGENGEVVSFNMLVTNRGDVREDAIEIVPLNDQAPTGWWMATDKTSVSLDPGESTNFTAYVFVPADGSLAPGNFVALMPVGVVSSADRTVQAIKGLQVIVKASFLLEIRAEPPEKPGYPGGFANFTITIENIGNLPGSTPINVSAVSPSVPGWNATLNAGTVYVKGGENTSVALSVAVPANASAGTRVTFTVSVLSTRYGTTAETTVNVTVLPVCGFAVEQPPRAHSSNGGFAQFALNATNSGNFALVQDVRIDDLPSGWGGFAFLDAHSLSRLALEQGETVSLDVTLLPRPGTVAGDYLASLRFSSETCGDAVVPLDVTVEPVHGFTMEASLDAAVTPLGGTAEYTLELHNLGNVLENVSFALSGLPEGATWVIRTPLDPCSPGDFCLPMPFPLQLEPFGNATLRLTLSLAPTAPDRGALLTLVAQTSSGDTATVGLTLTIEWPDAALSAARFYPEVSAAGGLTLATVTVTNLGSAATPTATVSLYIDGVFNATVALASIPPHGHTDITFPLTPRGGDHDLRFRVALPDGFQELDFTNNELHATLSVQAPPVAAAGLDAAAGTTLAIIAAGALAVFLIFRAPRRRPPREKPSVRANP